MKHSRIPDGDDPEMAYHLSDRDFNRRTYYMVVGLWLLVGASFGMSLAMQFHWL